MHKLSKTGVPIFVMIAAIITIGSGVLLIWKLSEGFEPAWFHTPYARVLTIGSGLAFIAFIVDLAVNRPAAMRINKISDAIASSGGNATNEQLNAMISLRKKIFTATNFIAVLLALAVVAMAICRYVG